MHHRGIREVELGPVRQHQRDGVAAADPERGESGRDLAHAVGVVAPGEGDPVVGRAEPEDVGVGGGGALEGRAEGAVVGSHPRKVLAPEGI